MADDPTRAELARRRAEFTAFRAQVARDRRRHRAWRRLLPLALAALLVALVPLAVLAATAFTDLNPGSIHNANINAIATAGITTGCNPPANDQFCPNDVVTREQMASFLARTAGIGGNPPVTRAASLAARRPGPTSGGFAANDLIRIASTGGSGDVTLDGSGTFQTVRTLHITLPEIGQVLLSGSVQVTGGTGTVTMRLRQVSAGNSTSPALTLPLGTGAGQVAQGPLSQTYVFGIVDPNVTDFVLEVQSSAA